MTYPLESVRMMAAHPHLGVVWTPAPEVLEQEDWPDCVFWQQKLDGCGLPVALRWQKEVKIGQRRKRKLAKLKAADGRPTLRRYESSIVEDQLIPMRERNLHDYFNALIWLRFPQAKLALHERAYRSYQEGGLITSGNLRNDLTDALTRFDEGGVAFFEDEGFAIFGHGLLEVWAQGGRKLTACVLRVPGVGDWDQRLAAVLREMAEPQGRFGTIDLVELMGRSEPGS